MIKIINNLLNKFRKIGRFHQILMGVNNGYLRITKKGNVKCNKKK